jgi:GT2 family glycosyltransferase
VSKNLTIIIVSFNSSGIIKSCLEKINFVKYDVIVVDNASIDNTSQVVSDSFPQAKIIKLDKNIGYGRANNVALEQVETEFSLILNPDAFIEQDGIEKIISLFDKNKKIALAGPLLLPNYPASINEQKEQLKIVNSNLLEKSEDFLSVKYIIGAVLFLRMSVFRKIGFFDKNIFLYYEDDEISFRAIKNGFKAAIIPSVFGFHIGQGSSGGKLRNIYKRFWHRALSKFYWKEKQKGKLKAIKSASWLSMMFLIRALGYLLLFNSKKSVENFASACGSISFVIGLKAFDKNDNPRG